MEPNLGSVTTINVHVIKKKFLRCCFLLLFVLFSNYTVLSTDVIKKIFSIWFKEPTAQIPTFYMDTSHLFSTQHPRLAPPTLAQQQGYQAGPSQVRFCIFRIARLFLVFSLGKLLNSSLLKEEVA